jgi:hypothetical protein
MDPAAGEVYVFAGSNPSSENAVYQISTSFATGGTLTPLDLATGAGAGDTQLAGTFDNTYYTSTNQTGNLWVGGAYDPFLWQIPITSNALGTAANRATIADDSTNYGWISPVTEYLNTSTAAAAEQTGTFTGVPVGTQTATITNGSNALTLTVTGTETATFSAAPSANSTLKIGNTTYEFESSAGSCSGSDRCVQISGTSTTAANLAKAIGGTCFNSGGCPGGAVNDPDVDAVNTSVSAAVYLVNITSGSITPALSGTTNISLSPTSIAAPPTANGCTSATTGTFEPSTSATTLGSNLAAAINSCNGSYPAVGVTASSASGVVTVTADSVGTAGNSIALTETLTNFSWAGTDLTGGSNGIDYVFLSVYESTESGCTDTANNGCILSFNVNTPTAVTLAGVDNIASPAAAPPTGGFIIDNSGTAAGESQIYFLTQYPSASSAPCTGICAVQVSQVP